MRNHVLEEPVAAGAAAGGGVKGWGEADAGADGPGAPAI